MLVFAIMFGALAVLGVEIGLGHVGHPIGGQSVQSFGWALAINGLALAAFFIWRAVLARRRRPIKQAPQPQRVHHLPRAAQSVTSCPEIMRDRGRTGTITLSDEPEAILNALVERVGTAGVDYMLRRRIERPDAA